jgi:hypothetical protein
MCERHQNISSHILMPSTSLKHICRMSMSTAKRTTQATYKASSSASISPHPHVSTMRAKNRHRRFRWFASFLQNFRTPISCGRDFVPFLKNHNINCSMSSTNSYNSLATIMDLPVWTAMFSSSPKIQGQKKLRILTCLRGCVAFQNYQGTPHDRDWGCRRHDL